jgi:acetylornithine/succinyldiaminopimelate/putrescine aminotransferase
MMLASGPRSVRFRPALNIDRETLVEGLQRVRRALSASHRSAGGI